MDIVRIFEEIAKKREYEFDYGSESHLNLIEGTGALIENKIHLLLFPVETLGVKNDLGLSFANEKYTGRFMLLVSSDFATHYFKDNGADQATSKYTKNIEPLKAEWKKIGNALICQNLDVEFWKNIDAVNVLDANKDGLWCNFIITTT